MRLSLNKVFQNPSTKSIMVCSGIVFFIFFTLYSLLGSRLAQGRAFQISGILFETDVPRVVGDMTDPSADHYRTKVHPIFVLLTNPLGNFLAHLVNSDVLAAILLNSLLGALGVSFALFYFYIFTKDLYISIILSVLFGGSASQLFLSSIPETATAAVCSLLATYILFIAAIKKFYIPDRVWVVSGILTLAITTTNFIQTCICFFIICIMQAPKEKKTFRAVLRFTVFLFSTILIAVVLSSLQNAIYPTSRLFYTLEFYEEETLYTRFVILQQPLTVISQLIRHFFMVNIIAPLPNVFTFGANGTAITFSYKLNYSFLGWLTLFLWSILFIFSFIEIFRSKQVSSLTIAFVFILCIIFNLSLHSIYGISADNRFEYFLYTGNFSFLIVQFVANLPYKTNPKLKNLLLLLTISATLNNILMLMKIVKIYT